jgi:hypothetical protein
MKQPNLKQKKREETAAALTAVVLQAPLLVRRWLVKITSNQNINYQINLSILIR